MFLPMLAGAGLGAGLAASGTLGATAAAMVGLGTMATLSAGQSAYQYAEAQEDALHAQANQRRLANEQNERLEKRRIERLLAMQRVATAGSGITFEGSPFQVSLDTAYQYEVDRSIRQFNSEIDQSRLRSEGDLSMMHGRSQLLNSLMGAGIQAYDRVERYSR